MTSENLPNNPVNPSPSINTSIRNPVKNDLFTNMREELPAVEGPRFTPERIAELKGESVETVQTDGVEDKASETVAQEGETGKAAEPKDPKEAEGEKLTFRQAAKEFRRVRAEKEALAKEKQEILPKAEQAKQLSEALATAKQNPIGALKALGIDPLQFLEDIAEGKLDPTQVKEPVVSTEDLIEKKLKAEREKWEKDNEEKQVRINREEYDKRVTSFKGNIESHVKSNSNDYPIIEAEGLQEAVFETWSAYVNHEDPAQRKVLTIKEAADLVEGFRKQQISDLYQKAFKAKQPEAKPEVVSKTDSISREIVKPVNRSLNNNMGVSSADIGVSSQNNESEAPDYYDNPAEYRKWVVDQHKREKALSSSRK